MDKQQEQITLLQGALSSAIDDLADIGQALAIIHNHELEPKEQESLLLMIWQKVEWAITTAKDIAGGEL